MNKDRFSAHSQQYATFRPTYPPALYEFILKQVHEKGSAWDCACGNGQVAKDLSPHFDKIHATDISATQLEHAFRKENIAYSVSSAEKTPFINHSFDLITVGQALHWLNIPEFFKEARRVAKPDAVLATWGYSLLNINKQMDPLINDFYVNIVGPYWDKERRLVDTQYMTVDFPFERIHAPDFQFSFQWTLDELAGYLSTWSSVQKYIGQHNVNPVEGLIKRLKPYWKKDRYEVRLPLFLLVGRIVK